MEKAIAYYRVSTGRQKRSGLGLDAQAKAVTGYARNSGYDIIEDYTDAKSGRWNARIGLTTALAQCKNQDATLLIATLDRLSRRVAFISALLESKVRLKVADNPNADEFTLHILAAMAQKERKDNSKRTRDALAAAKSRGRQLGVYGKYILSRYNKLRADHFAWTMKPIIEGLKRKGVTTIRGIAHELNLMHIPTYCGEGHRWHPRTIQNLLKRIYPKQSHLILRR